MKTPSLIQTLLLSAALVFSTAAQAQTYNARNDFSITQNPNGVWSYGSTDAPASNVFRLSPVADTANSCQAPLEYWHPASSTAPPVGRTAGFVCGEERAPAELLLFHPSSSGQRAVLRWTAPAAGTYLVNGVFQAINYAASTDVKISKNETEPPLFSGLVNGYQQQPFNFTVTVAVGDTIDFSVGYGTNLSWISDATGLAVTIGQPVTACETAPANLQVFVPAENSPSDVQSGNTNASLVGNATYTNGKVGRAFSFDGDGDYVRIEDNAAQRPANAVTVEGWFKFNSLSGIPVLVSKPRGCVGCPATTENSYVLYVFNGVLHGATATRIMGSPFSPQTGVWYHLAYVFDDAANTHSLFVNGVSVASDVNNEKLAYDANPYPLLIGAEIDSNAPQLFQNGQADEVSIYNRALTQAELFDIARQGSFGKCGGTAGNCVPVPTDLNAWYPGDGDTNDVQGGTSGTLKNGATFAPGKVRQAFSLDGVDDFVEVPDAPALNPANGITVEAWVFRTAQSAGDIISKDGEGFARQYILNVGQNNKFRAHIGVPGGLMFVDSSTTAPLNTWTHVAMTYDGNNLKLYVNGVLEGSIPVTGPIFQTTQPVRIGGGAPAGQPQFFFAGLIDEVQIYNRALAEGEIGAIVNSGSAGTCRLIRFLAPANNAVIDEGSPVALTVEADSTVTSVAFYDNGSLVTRKTGAPFDTTLPGLSAGVHLLTAIAETPGGGTNPRAQVRVVVNPAGGTTYTFSGAGSWNTPGNWTPTGVPGANDSAIVSSSVVIPADLTLRALALEGSAVFTGPGNLTVTENLTFLSGTMRDVALTIPMAGRIVLLSDATKTFEGAALRNEGTMILAGAGSISGDAATTVQNFGLFTFAFQSDTTTGQYETEATVGTFINNGTVDVDGGSLQTVGEYVQEEGVTNLGCARAGARIEKLYGRIEALNVAVESGTMTGSGRILGNLVTRLKAAKRAYLRLGCSPGTIEVTGDLTLTDNATVVVEVGGTQAGEYSELKVAGQATLDGELIVTTAGFTPSQSDTFDFLTYGSVAGTFDTVSSNAQIALGNAGAEFSVSGPNPPAPKALNIATRMKVETGDNALIAGFIITGSQSKKVIIRGIGPSLPFGGILADPTLSLDNGAVTNDNWRTDQEQEIIATTIPPSNNLESAIVATLNPGPHTAILRGSGSATGIGVVEVYDLESGAPVQLANISSRGFVQSGDDVMIGGFIIGGTYPAKVVVRAIGPSLPFQGVLADPTLELVNQNGGRISNDNWRETQEAEIIATTIPPTNDNEAAIVATLAPGNYTAIVRGVDETTGIAVVEAYNLQ